ncbi:ABC transporter ATP-binding protein [Mangrovibacterium lignilyticum]|uniref:ABC transporter ATP-binding protein n=1 Tax=Mangrovibacterium lignilyticum TaxID=2668052 RepID=UPI0019687B8F|nr:ABC transporter transmembrane domain-containing protein [Mangrovibacterium lignilyticum]
MKPYRVEFFTGLFFLFITSLATLAFPKLLGILVDLGTTGQSQHEINHVVLMLAGVLTLQAISSFIRTNMFVRVTSKTLAAIRQHTYSHLIRLPMSFFLKRRVGELNSRISSDISLLEDTLTSTVADFLRTVLIIIGGVTFLFFISAHLTLFMLMVLPVIVIIAIIFGRFIKSFSKKVQQGVADSNTIVEETLQGVQNVKAYANEFFEIGRYTEKTNQVALTGIQGGWYRSWFSAFMIAGMFGAMLAVIWRGTSMIATGQIDAGQLFSFVLYTAFIAGMMGGLADVYARLQKAIGATENLLEILDEPIEKVEPQTPIAPENQLEGNIEFKQVSFRYPSRQDVDVLQNISVKIEANQQIALVGPSGAGKSTIVNLLMNFYEASAGEILFDGKDIRTIPLTALRQQIAVVPQDVFLFGGTIRENIAYGCHKASDEEIIEAAKNANAWSFIQESANGLESIVGERGIQLSGGQRQRVAIARAMLKNPRILILDEATSALDSESERQVQEALEKLMKGRTSIVIAHRLSTIRSADQILVLDFGQIIQQGTHQELVEDISGLYYTLSELQFTS